MADANLTKRIAELEAEIARLKAETTTLRPPRRRLGGKLSDRKLKTYNSPGRIIGDGNNLLYKCGGLGHGCFLYRYKAHGRAYDIGLGGYPAVSLAEARIARDEHNRLRNQGHDPADERRQQKLALKLVRAKAMTLAQSAEGWFQGQEKGWRSPKHARQVTQILADYIDPVLGDLPVQMVDTGHVMQVVEPLWLGGKVETGSRARQIVEAVLDWGRARELRSGENPARWKGHLDKLLAPKSKVRTVTHHKALCYTQVPGFMERLKQDTSLGSLALQVTILCALRTSELRLGQWREIDLTAKVWVIPGTRMKAGKEHKVPLTEPVAAILEQLRRDATGPFVFATPGAVKPIGANAMLQVLARLGVKATTHGFRSSFSDWAAETTHFPNEVREMALAHAIPNVVEAAYRRSDLFTKRAQLMEAWARFCTSPVPEGEVVAFTAAREAA